MTERHMTERGLFLKGDSGIGKSTLLLALLEPYWKTAGGYLSQRLLGEAGETRGFCLIPAGESEEPPKVSAAYESGLLNIFIEKTENGWEKRPEVFASTGTAALKAVLERGNRCSFCYLDEIGGVELKSKEFMELLYQVLESGVFCVGVLKNSKNLESMKTRVPVVSDLDEERDRLEERLAGQYGCRICSFTGTKEEKSGIRRFLKEQFLKEQPIKEHTDCGIWRGGKMDGS